MDTELFNFISFKEFARAFSSMLFLIIPAFFYRVILKVCRRKQR